MFTIGIDATNIRSGGGLTHLNELLNSANLDRVGIQRIVLWSNRETLRKIQNYSWLKKKWGILSDSHPLLNILWQSFYFSHELVSEKCDILFVVGGTYMGNFRPFVTMHRNLLPFDVEERKHYFLSMTYFRLQLLAITQQVTFKSANGIIFLTEYCLKKIENRIGIIKGRKVIINHGVNKIFFKEPILGLKPLKNDKIKPVKILYVSTIDHYKNQGKVSKAIKILRKKKYNVELDLVGNSYPPALKYLKEIIYNLKLPSNVIKYHGAVHYQELKNYYHNADIFVFASTCETFGQILVEAMASGLSIACSNKSAMPEILGNGGVYFNAKDPNSISQAIEVLINSQSRRESYQLRAFNKAKLYSWDNCAEKTFSFISEVYKL